MSKRRLYLTFFLIIILTAGAVYLDIPQGSKISLKPLKISYQKTFKLINRSNAPDQWTQMIHGLYDMRQIVIQSMFVKGRLDNTSAQEIDEWIKIIRYIQPEGVQIYTVDRSPQHSDILPVSEETLNQIAKRVNEKTRIPAFVYA